ncbi:hypothetical protein CCUS01_11043 [Colletotrichum cuscutae]|uniref:Uncharacterized protein n=1 Tax=Colletotrichum cuscutae TaxID=1209917 RepID=A0AAI9U873_9PEZI|nr:hypothetical protein CCUS01_11043 [Colletotrichum cuscutae]
MMICWTRAFGSVMIFRSAVSELVDRRFPSVAAASHFGFTAPARQRNLGSWLFQRPEKDERKRNLDTRKYLIWATISTWQKKAHGRSPIPSCFPAIPPFMARGSI